MDNIYQQLLLQLILILLNAFFAMSEIAVISFNDTKLEKLANEGNKKAKKLNRLLKDPAKFLATIQVAITLSGFMGSAFASQSFADGLVNLLQSLGISNDLSMLHSIAVVVITIILSYITLVLGELVPKRIGQQYHEQIALFSASIIKVVAKIFGPLVWLLTVSTNFVLRLVGIDPNAIDREIGEEEILMMVDASSVKGTIDIDEALIIGNIFKFDDKYAEELLTHRSDVIFLDANDEFAIWKEIVDTNEHSIYPIVNDSMDEVLGIVHVRDVYRTLDKDIILNEKMRKPYFVYENMRADYLFASMKAKKESMAIVVDEYGGVTGIITYADILEEIVGEFVEESLDNQIRKLREHEYLVYGTTPIENVDAVLGSTFTSDEYETVGGFLFHHFDQIPDDGTQPSLRIGKYKFKVIEIKNRRIVKAIIKEIVDE